MKKCQTGVLTAVVFLSLVLTASAQQQVSWSSTFKSAAQAAGQAAIQSLTPQSQATIDQAKKLATPAQQESFVVTKAKEFLGAGNYQTAMELANYVVTTLNSKSVDGQKIMADAKAALAKMAQDKLMKTQQATTAQTQAAAAQSQVTAAQQVTSDAAKTVEGVKSLFKTQPAQTK